MKLKKIGLRKGGARLATEGEKKALAEKIKKETQRWAKKTLGG